MSGGKGREETLDPVAEVERLRAEVERLRRSEEALREAQANVVALIENTDDFVVFCDAQGRPQIFNSNYAAAMKQMLGLDMKPGVQPHKLLDPAQRDYWDALHARVLAGEKFQAEFGFGEGADKRYFEHSFNPVFKDGEVVGFCEYTREITAHKKVEAELQAARQTSERNYRLLFEGMLDGYVLLEVVRDESAAPVDFRFLEANAAFEVHTGVPSERLRETLASEIFSLDTGSWLPRLVHAAESGEAARFEEFSPTVGRHFEVSVFRPEHDQIALVLQDVTSRRRLEEEQRRSERLESVGLLAGGIAHDFNNILAALVASIQLSRLELRPDGRGARLLAEAEEACLRASGLTKQLLTFSRGGQPVKKTMQLRERLRHWVDFALRGLNVKAEIHVADDLWAVEADEGQIGQVIHNLVCNADQAMPEGGTVVVRADNQGRGPVELGEVEGDRFVTIRVEDGGTGIPREALPKIFDAYFTTKDGGSGLGLTTSYSIVKHHGGALRASSEPGKGSTFEVWLPATSGAQASRPSTRPPPPGQGAGRVLFMDDDEQLRTIAQAALEHLCFEVDVAAHGEDAIRLYRAALDSGRRYDWVVLDLTVRGGMGGKETVARLRQLDPGVCAVVSSGYSDDRVLGHYREHGFCAVANKPYRMEDLARILRQAMVAR